MKYVDEYRDPAQLNTRLDELRRLCRHRWTIMDVCGGQTHNLLRHGIEAALADVIELIHGPGCPVCVTPAEAIDDAVALGLNHGAIVTTFGDMLRVPGRSGSLLQARAYGAEVRTVYSPCDAVRLASQQPDRPVIFFAVGFETTIPATALAILQAEQQGLKNFTVLCQHVRVEPAMRAVVADPTHRISAFLAAGHVCTVTGYADLEPLARDFGLPVVVTGFEPLDLAEGLIGCVKQLNATVAYVENRYARFVRREGNQAALRMIDRVFQVCDTTWRGLGELVDGGFSLRAEYAHFDARQQFGLVSWDQASESHADSYCGRVLSGRMKPLNCPLFGNRCTPESPQGAPMVSSEGACAAYFKYANCAGADHA